MKIYDRNISKKILLIRLSFIALLLLVFFLFTAGLKDYGYVVIMLLIFSSVFRISTIALYDDRIEVRFFYFFGLIPFKVDFKKEAPVTIDSFEIALDDPATTDSGAEIFFARSASIKRYIIESIDYTGNVKQVKIDLSWEELQLIRQHFINKDELPMISGG